MKSFNWLHISDLHYDEKNRDVLRNRVTQGFLRCVQEDLPTEFLPLNAIFITGDLAFSGSMDQYGTKENYGPVRKFLNELATVTGVKAEHIAIVPGNHDMNRRRIEPYHGIGNLPIEREGSDMLFSSGKTLGLLGEKFSDFVTLADEYPSTWRDGRYRYLTKVFKFNDMRIGVIGINSAWFTGKTGQDKGKLFVGPSLLKAAFEDLKTNKPDLKIVLLHHPTEWLHVSESREIKDLLTQNADLVLSGHMHDDELVNLSTVYGTTSFVQTGALYQGYRYARRFMVGRWLPSNKRFEIQPYIFRDDKNTNCWEIENANLGTHRRGQPSYWVFDKAPGIKPQNKRLAYNADDLSLEPLVPERPIAGRLNRPLGCIYIKTTNKETLKLIDSVHYRYVNPDRDHITISPIVNRAQKSRFAQTFSLYGPTEIETVVVFNDKSERPMPRVTLIPPMH